MGGDVTNFERIGGEPALRSIIDRFVDRIFDDIMIGFFFRKAKRKRIKRFEYEHAAVFLGADAVYTGRDLEAAHAAHPIMGGQFDRRKQILREVLESFAVPDDVRDAWLEYTESLRPLITRDPDSDCDPTRALDKVRNSDGRDP